MSTSLANLPCSIDLTAARSVHLLEPHWNPMVEDQAVDRVHRMGQSSSEVSVFRYVTKNTIEKVRSGDVLVYRTDFME